MNEDQKPEEFSEGLDENSENSIVFYERNPTLEEEEDLRSSLLKSRERTRSTVTLRLIWLLGITFAATIILSGLVIFVPATDEGEREDRFNFSKDIFSILLSTQTGLIGAALGFYFGSKEDS